MSDRYHIPNRNVWNTLVKFCGYLKELPMASPCRIAYIQREAISCYDLMMYSYCIVREDRAWHLLERKMYKVHEKLKELETLHAKHN